MKVITRPDYLLLLGNDSMELFEYYDVDELHGLNVVDCALYPETKDNAYIAGMSNYSPFDRGFNKIPKPYVFINTKRLQNNFEDITLLMHELMHQALLQYNWDMDYEEEMISWAEAEANYLLGKSIIPSYQQPGIITMSMVEKQNIIRSIKR
jgi:hypothetical protein